MVGKSKSPACIKNRAWPVKYMAQKRAWVDTEICWRWFDEVFLLEIENRTGYPVLLIVDNAPGHFKEFTKNNVTVKLLPPNVTSWKQPMDLGIIASLKKRYKHLYLKNILHYFKLDEDEERQLTEQAKSQRRGSTGVAYGKPAHLLDAANYISQAWDAVSPTTIKNCFCKADLGMDLHYEDVDDVSCNEFVSLFNEIRITINESEIEEFIQLDNEGSHDYNECILTELNESVEEVQNQESLTTTGDADNFKSFKDLYSRSLPIGKDLSSAKAKSAAGEKYDKFYESFRVFQNNLRNACGEEQQINQEINQ